MTDQKKKLTVLDLLACKKSGEKVVMVSCPDFTTAMWAERAGVDFISVGDSIGMVVYGYPNTLSVTVDMMIAHTQAARRGAPNTFIKVSMPYGSYVSEEVAIRNAFRVMKESGADSVKIQGGKEKAPIIKAMADAGIPVMTHIGMAPHYIHTYGGFKIQGKTAEDAVRIVEDALAVQEAGAVGFEIEAIPAPVGRAVDEAVDIFNWGVGAGPHCSGQILLSLDMLGMYDLITTKFTKRYAQLADMAVDALKEYASEVKAGTFPDEAHSYSMKPEEEEKMWNALGK